MDQNNKISSDVMPVGKIPKGKKSRTRAQPVPQRPSSRSMTATQWRDLTSAGGSAVLPQQEERKRPRGSEQCEACDNYKITAASPATVCTLCRRKWCQDCAAAGGIKTLSAHKAADIPDDALNRNEYERKLLTDYLKAKKVRVREIFIKELAEMENTKWTYKNVGDEDVVLKKDDNICAECFEPVWTDLIYRYREAIQSSMPEAARKRQNCWYGKECTTQAHNPNHAKNYNHICNKRPDK
eukprot:TRINITY_DN10569_c0_g1_i11.p2 TRINITY_DN10569_c0_g1~~TRINITY_DN10569_c0_g1_i11.p2  ORF type:complete len:240 (-),score=49.28 TRINITY_DN10569_c0_g1_i11:38-757(-)